MNARPILDCDTECYPDYWLFKGYDERTKQFHSFGTWDGHPLDIAGIVNLLSTYTIITFNGNHYDIQMITLALYGATCAQLKEANDDIIVRQMQPWTFRDKWGIVVPEYIDHIDIMEPSPGVRIGLKMYMGRLHAPTIQDLPYDPDTRLDAAGRFVIADYCGNDVHGTYLLRHEIQERLDLRVAIGKRHGIDVRSKSDAQIAEAVIKAELKFQPARRTIRDGFTFTYDVPEFIQYVTPQMQELLQVVRDAQFVVRDKEEAVALGYFDEDNPIRTGVRIPEELSGRDIIIGATKYRMGIGGLHSQESSVHHHSWPGQFTIKDVDVKSYYPSLILMLKMYPEQLGPAFQIIYRAIYERRLLSKSEAARISELFDATGAPELQAEAHLLKTESDGLKIVLNGTFGKLFSKWSIMFAPELGIRITITGQLALLMLIEMMECSGIQCVSANTDGVVLKIPAGLEALARQIVAWWEKRTGMEMEETVYRAIYMRDVNNYVAFTSHGKVKRKGVFNQGGVVSGTAGKGPNMDICADALVAYLQDGTPIADTIMACKDVRKFIVLRGVTGGGYYIQGNNEPVYLGKAVRWYYGGDPAAHVVNKQGNRVATSNGAHVCMHLPTELPNDINYGKYINTAICMLADVGLPVRYWSHPESNCKFPTYDNNDIDIKSCVEITKKEYDK